MCRLFNLYLLFLNLYTYYIIIIMLYTNFDTSTGTLFEDAFEAISNTVDMLGDITITNRNNSSMDNDIFGPSVTNNNTTVPTTTNMQDSLLYVEVGPKNVIDYAAQSFSRKCLHCASILHQQWRYTTL